MAAGQVNTTRATVLRQAAAGTEHPARREQLATTAAIVAAQPDAHPLPGDVPLFDEDPS